MTGCVTGGGGTKLDRNEVDEFTGKRVKISTYEKASDFYESSGNLFNFIRFRKIDNVYMLDLKATLFSGAVFAVERSSKMMIKLSSGDIIELKAVSYEMSCSGCGAVGLLNAGVQGISQTYLISEDQIKNIIKSPPSKIRLYMTDGYADEPVPAKEASNIVKIAELIVK